MFMFKGKNEARSNKECNLVRKIRQILFSNPLAGAVPIMPFITMYDKEFTVLSRTIRAQVENPLEFNTELKKWTSSNFILMLCQTLHLHNKWVRQVGNMNTDALRWCDWLTKSCMKMPTTRTIQLCFRDLIKRFNFFLFYRKGTGLLAFVQLNLIVSKSLENWTWEKCGFLWLRFVGRCVGIINLASTPSWTKWHDIVWIWCLQWWQSKSRQVVRVS